jgi:hypothetical protein
MQESPHQPLIAPMTPHMLTLVTAVFDLGRDRLAGDFWREPAHYRKHLPATLAIDCPMVVYTEPGFVDLVKQHRQGKPTQIVVTTDRSKLDRTAIERIETIRNDPVWRAQAWWLAQSPQASLPGYNALVMSKPLWLAEQAAANPFGTEYFYWIDAGLGHTVSPEWLQGAALKRLPQLHRHFLLLCFPYEPAGEVHGFDSAALAELAGVDASRWVARGGFFGGDLRHVGEVAGHYREALDRSLRRGLMGTEESLLTLLSYAHPELFDLQWVGPDGLVWPFFRHVCAGWPGDTVTARERLADLTETWFISYNAPRQFEALLQSIERVAPELLCTAERVLVNNTTDAALIPDYERLCARYDIRHIRQDNIGINSARLLAAEVFYRGGRHAMFWFEDDMLLVGKDESPPLCVNGLVRHVPDLAAVSQAILMKENADYLKFSFTEVFGSHREQWAWVNLDAEKQARYFPHVNAMPPAELSAPKMLGNTGYVTGEVFYGNWPHLITRRGTQKLFLEQRSEKVYEQGWCARSFELLRGGTLKAAVLLASPVNHHRIQDYDPASRRECAAEAAPLAPSYRERRIFVSIANYRDSEAPHTLRDLFARAAHPERIFVGLFSQVVPGVDDDCLPAGGYAVDQVRELRCDASESQGACWARHRILTELMADEDYVLQIDSHSRFMPGWDERFIAMLNGCPSPRALLTTYPARYVPPNRLGAPCTPMLVAQEFNKAGVLLVEGKVSLEQEFPPVPLPSAFLSGNCLFGPAAAFREVPYDPWLYFHGEEISMGVRLWTHGWDLFAPNDLLMYTDYSTDRGRPRHWDDQPGWDDLNLRSFFRLRQLFGIAESPDPEALREFERYGLGRVRSLADYEAFADVSFAQRHIGPRAKAGRFSLPAGR